MAPWTFAWRVLLVSDGPAPVVLVCKEFSLVEHEMLGLVRHQRFFPRGQTKGSEVGGRGDEGQEVGDRGDWRE